jgi:hypothetical protein
MSETTTSQQVCPAHGAYEAKALLSFMGRPMMSRCPMCVDSVIADDVSIKIRTGARAIRYDSLYPYMAVPPLFRGSRFASIDHRIHSVAYSANKNGYAYRIAYEGLRRPMIIISQRSTGKTMIGCITLNEYMINGNSTPGGVVVGYTTLEDMTRRVIDGSRNRDNVTHIMEAYTSPDLLFIDDVHGIRDSVQSILFRVIDSRYLQKKGLIMASSMAHAVLREHLGERIISRLNHMRAFVCTVKKEDIFRLQSNVKPWYKKDAISSSNVRGFPPPAQTGIGEA